MKSYVYNTTIHEKIELIIRYIGNKKYVVITNGEVIDEFYHDSDGITIRTISENRYYEFNSKSDMSDFADLYFIVAKTKLVIENLND